VDRIIEHLNLTFVAEKPPPSHVLEQVALMAAEERAMLTSIHGRNYPFHMKCSLDSELNGSFKKKGGSPFGEPPIN
jgi:hypothetical protein